MDKIKIFLAYHKPSPCYKSDVFQPVHSGADNSNEQIEFALADNTGDNISILNPYYCELTAQYWVLKNYIPNCDKEYIGFAHYRRLPDLISVTSDDIPSIYGISYSQSVKLFNELNRVDLYEYIKNYDVIAPCKCYMYNQTVNPEKKEGNLDTYTHFKTMHRNNLLDVSLNIIRNEYPDYRDAIEDCLYSEKSYFYNTYIMKTEVMRKYLELLFDILDKTGKVINGWNNSEYLRMGGFLAEFIFSMWISNNSSLILGHCPVYMIDFEADIIDNINKYHSIDDTEKEISELKKLLDITSNKYAVLSNLLRCYLKLNDFTAVQKYVAELSSVSTEAEQFYQLANILSNYQNCHKNASEFYLKALSFSDCHKICAQDFLNFAKNAHDLELTRLAWDMLARFELTQSELEYKKRFFAVYKTIHN